MRLEREREVRRDTGGRGRNEDTFPRGLRVFCTASDKIRRGQGLGQRRRAR